jgi:enoyl-CoA hydratase/carnithine racemase
MRAGVHSTDRGGQYGIIRRYRTKPLIAAVEGAALGGGFEVVLSCDLVVASKTAEFGLPEVKRSLVPICGGLFRAPKALPRNVARELLLTGDSITAKRAYKLGLASILSDAGEALEDAVGLAERICLNGPVAVRETMRFLASLDAPDEAHGWEETLESEDVIRNAEDTREGVMAFFEKRPPNWSGR